MLHCRHLLCHTPEMRVSFLGMFLLCCRAGTSQRLPFTENHCGTSDNCTMRIARPLTAKRAMLTGRACNVQIPCTGMMLLQTSSSRTALKALGPEPDAAMAGSADAHRPALASQAHTNTSLLVSWNHRRALLSQEHATSLSSASGSASAGGKYQRQVAVVLATVVQRVSSTPGGIYMVFWAVICVVCVLALCMLRPSDEETVPGARQGQASEQGWPQAKRKAYDSADLHDPFRSSTTQHFPNMPQVPRIPHLNLPSQQAPVAQSDMSLPPASTRSGYYLRQVDRPGSIANSSMSMHSHSSVVQQQAVQASRFSVGSHTSVLSAYSSNISPRESMYSQYSQQPAVPPIPVHNRPPQIPQLVLGSDQLTPGGVSTPLRATSPRFAGAGGAQLLTPMAATPTPRHGSPQRLRPTSPRLQAGPQPVVLQKTASQAGLKGVRGLMQFFDTPRPDGGLTARDATPN